MAYDNSLGKESAYNWAALFIRDLDEQARALSMLVLMLDRKDPETNKYYYEEAPDYFSNFIVKLSGHLKDTELKIAREFRDKVIKQVKNKPINSVITSVTFSGNKKSSWNNQVYLQELKDLIFDFQILLAKWIEEHKLGTPEVKDVTRAAVDL